MSTPSNRKDLIGKTFGRLLVLNRVQSDKNGCSMFNCLCVCGKQKTIKGTSLTKIDGTESCGCLITERIIRQNKLNSKHGLSGHPLFYILNSMNDRCYNQNSNNYKRYGAKGVLVCDEWRKDFSSFYNWCMENGWIKGLQIDRYPNKSGNYEPSNCRVVTGKVNCNNRNDNVYATIDGVTHTPSEWSDITGVNKNSIRARISKYKLTGKHAVYGKKSKPNKNEKQ